MYSYLFLQMTQAHKHTSDKGVITKPTMSIPDWIKKGNIIEAWLPPVGGIHNPSRWLVKILEVHAASSEISTSGLRRSSRRRQVDHVTASWSGDLKKVTSCHVSRHV